MKIFKKSVWVMLSVFFAILLAVAVVGASILNENQAAINGLLGITPYEKVDVDDGTDTDTEYYKSDFYQPDGSYDDRAMREYSEKIALQTAVEGSVLLWNDNNVLPLKKQSKVNLFGVSSMVDNWSIPSRHFLIQGEGSGMMYDQDAGIIRRNNLTTELGNKGIAVNEQLVRKYNDIAGTYRKSLTKNSDLSYKFGLKEAPWSEIASTAEASLDGGAAVMIISRNAGEYKDILVGSRYVADTHLDEYNYLDLSLEEADVLDNLKRLKEEGKISGIVLLINSANPVQFKHIREGYGIDACAFIGMGGTMSFVQIAELLTAQDDDYVLSGHLPDTFVYSAQSAPAFENYGDFTWTEYSDELPDLAAENKGDNNTHNTKYVVYQEGIYVGYKYYETRYEDAVLGRGNASSDKGVKAGSGNWSYKDEVAFPFGYGLSYTDFGYSAYKVTENADGDYEVSLTIENTGDTYSGKETLQVYLQKPYTEDYDVPHKIEKAAVELVGIAKTGKLAPGEKQTLTVTVDKEAFRTYDAYNKGTYILEKGDYYLAAGSDAHDALNNILAAKPLTPAQKARMVDSEGNGGEIGNAAFAHKITVAENDFDIFSKSEETGNEITNRFDNADINLYEGTKDQKIEYLSRNDWSGTYPDAGGVPMKCTDATMVKDMQYGAEVAVKEGDKMPVYGRDNGLTLAMLMEYGYDDPLWNDLLDQMTLAEQQWLCSYGLKFMAGVTSVAAPGSLAHDGPVGLKTKNPTLNSQMCFPSPVNMAATWDLALIEKLGIAFGHEILHADYSVIYAPGANIHRTAYAGRNWEYFSEDGFLSGKMLSAEVRGLQSRGVIVITKHFALNDQETNRYGVTTWVNEQTIRETYISAFEIAIREGKMNGVMSSFNRLGCTWTGAHKGLLTDVLRNEWDFTGIVESDACAGGVAHMTGDAAKAAGLVAGNDLWMDSGSEKYFEAHKKNPTVMQALREASKRILYGQLHSNAMNGLKSSTKIVKVEAWWQTLLVNVQITIGVFCGLMLVMAALSFIFATKKFNGWYGERLAVAATAKAERIAVIAARGEPAGKGYYVSDKVSEEASSALAGPIQPGYYIDGKKQRVSGKVKDILILAGSVVLAVAITLSATLPFIFAGQSGGADQGCGQICGICGGCLDTGCGDCEFKCGDDKTEYEFEAENAAKKSGVDAPADLVSEKGTTYVGNFDENKGAGLVFNIYAEQAAVATLVATVNRRTVDTTFTNHVKVEVNGNKLTSPKVVKATTNGAEDRITFVDMTLGCVNLQAGNNVIEFTLLNDLGYNFDMIKLRSDEPLRETYTTYEFKGAAYAIPAAGNKGMPKKENNGFIGNLSTNENASLTFTVVSERECTAILSAAVTGRRQGARKFTDGFYTTVNGGEVVSDVVVPAGVAATEWSKSYQVTLGEIELKAGENTLVFTVPVGAVGYEASNFDYIVITSGYGVTCTSSYEW